MISWQRDLESATSPAEVVQLTRRYIAAMPPDAFASLPEGCRPRLIASADDVLDWSERINQAYWRLRRESADVAPLQDIWGFFLRATTRLARFSEERTPS